MVTEEFACQIPRAHRPNPNRMMASVARCLTRDMRWMFRSYLTDGALYVDRRCKGRAEGFLFASAAEERLLRVISPARTIAKYHVSGRFGQGSIECFDFDGELVCSKQVSEKDLPQPQMDRGSIGRGSILFGRRTRESRCQSSGEKGEPQEEAWWLEV